MGVPDILIFTPCGPNASFVLGIELKTDKGRLSPAQIKTHTDLSVAGVRVHVARSVEDVARILEAEGVKLHATIMSGGGLKRAA